MSAVSAFGIVGSSKQPGERTGLLCRAPVSLPAIGWDGDDRDAALEAFDTITGTNVAEGQ
jgi:hypothetical protein